MPVAVPVRGPTSDGQRSMPVLVTGSFIVPAPVSRNMERPRPIGRGRSMGFASWSDETEQRGEHGGEPEQGYEGERHAEHVCDDADDGPSRDASAGLHHHRIAHPLHDDRAHAGHGDRGEHEHDLQSAVQMHGPVQQSHEQAHDACEKILHPVSFLRTVLTDFGSILPAIAARDGAPRLQVENL